LDLASSASSSILLIVILSLSSMTNLTWAAGSVVVRWTVEPF